MVLPSNAYEAKGLLDPGDPATPAGDLLQHKAMYDEEAEVPDEAYAIRSARPT
ncbi:MAG: hypothetical protein U1E17_01265 [Geminicoccaceae bacterium]